MSSPARIPGISAIVPNYNQGATIGATLEALLAQSVPAAEIIVVDDGSTDGSVPIVEALMRRAPTIKLLRNPQNRGAWFSMQRALSVAAGEFLYLHAADDLVLPGFFEKSLALLRQHPQAGLCCSFPTFFPDAPEPRHDANPTFWSPVARYFPPPELAEIISGDYIACHTSIIRHEAWRGITHVPVELAWHADWFMVLAIAFRHGICYLPEPLASIRTGAATYSSAGKKRWPDQKQVLTSLLTLLKGDHFRDLLPHFARGSILSHFGPQIVQAVMESPEHWDPVTLMLIQQPLSRWTNRITATIDQRELRQACAALEMADVLRVASQHIAQGKLDTAEALLGDCTRRFPQAAAVYQALATLERARGDAQAALRQAKRAFDLDPADDANQAGLVLALVDMNQGELAERLCDTLVSSEAAARQVMAGLHTRGGVRGPVQARLVARFPALGAPSNS